MRFLIAVAVLIAACAPPTNPARSEDRGGITERDMGNGVRCYTTFGGQYGNDISCVMTR